MKKTPLAPPPLASSQRALRGGRSSASPPRTVIAVPGDVAKGSGLPIKMLHDRILVSLRREDGERRSTGGILIPATAQVAKRLVWGEARGVGSSVRQVKVGDQVLFSPEDQHEVEVHGEELVILRERDVHAVAAERIEESTGLYL